MKRVLDRRVLLPAYGGYLLVLLYLVLWPQPDTASSGVDLVGDILRRSGLPSVTDEQVEVGLNVALFVPLGLIGSMLLPQWRVWSWAVVGLALSLVLEATQWALLPSRTATWTDVVANTLGSLAGALLVALARRELSTGVQQRAAEPSLLSRRALVLIGLAIAAAVVVLVFTPTAEISSSVVNWIARNLRRAGAPHWLGDSSVWEPVLNVLLFVPVGVLGALTRPGWSLVRWAVVGATLSLVIELAQGTLLAGREASLVDVATNSAGMVIGAAIVHVWRQARTAVVEQYDDSRLRGEP